VLEDNTVRTASVAARLVPHLVERVVEENVLEDTEAGLHVIAGTLAIDANWSAAHTYVLVGGDTTVAAGSTLTLQPGVVLKFEATGGYVNDRDLNIDGELVTLDGDAPVVFTSLRDDTAGGDTNGDGVVTPPGAGNWGRIRVADAGELTLRNAEIRFAGGGDTGNCCQQARATDAALSVGGDATIEGSLVRDSQADGIRITGGSGVISDNEMRDNNGHGIRVAPAACDDWELDQLQLEGNGAGNAVEGCP